MCILGASSRGATGHRTRRGEFGEEAERPENGEKFDGSWRLRYSGGAGWSSLVARRAHNPKVVSSNLTPATNFLGNRVGKAGRSEEHTSELQSRGHLVCRLLLEKKKKKT